MKKTLLITLGCCLCFAISAFAQQNAEGLELSGQGLEERNARLAGTLNSYRMAVINFAKENGQSVEDAGIFMGRFFAPIWPKDITPAGFVNIMNGGWGKYGIKTEVLEQNSESVTGRRARPFDAASFAEQYGWTGGNVEEFEQFQEAMIREIAKQLGLIYTEERQAEVIVFTVKVQS